MAEGTTDFFVAKQTDWAVEALNTLYGQESLLSGVLSLYNAIFLSIGGTILLALMIRVVVETAQHGQLAGKHSEVWFPIRFFVAVGLLAPLPPVGMTCAQYVVIGVAKMGVAAGSAVWEKAATQMANLDPVVLPTPPEVKTLAKAMWQIEICRAVQNTSALYSAGTTISDPLSGPEDFGPWRRYSANGSSSTGGVDSQCGTIIYRHDPGLGDTPSPILRAHEAAAMAMHRTIRSAAESVAPSLLPSDPDGNRAPPINLDISGIMRTYTASVMEIARAEVATKNGQKLQAQKDAAISGGWVKAGSWAINLLWANQTVWDAVGSLPMTSPPRYDWWDSRVYEAHRAAFVAADQWWDARVARMAASTNRDAYNGSLAPGFNLAQFFDLSRIKGFYDWFLLDEHSNNPISEMVGLGYNLVDSFWAASAAFGLLSADAAAAQNWSSSTIEGIVANFAVGGTASASAAGLTGFLSAVAPVFWLLAASLLGAGISLAYVLPMMPSLHWLFGVVRYFMQVSISVLGAPVWAIAHLELEGEGIGNRAMKGYEILYDLLCRPIIMTAGLVVGFASMIVFGKLFALTYAESIGNAMGGHFGGVTGLFAFTVIGVATLLTICHLSMWGVSKGADKIMQMAGIHSIGNGDTDGDVQSVSHKTDQASGSVQNSVVAGTGVKDKVRAGQRKNDRAEGKEGRKGADMGGEIGKDGGPEQ
jgi:conjugal transfer/type IV secretion protein DotA/TraY